MDDISAATLKGCYCPRRHHLEEAQIVLKHRIEKLPIVDDEYRLIGLITVKDIEKNPVSTQRKTNARLLVAAALELAG